MVRLRPLLPFLATPPALLGLLVFAVGGLALVLGPIARPAVPLAQVDLEEAGAASLELEEVSLVVSDPNHLLRTAFVQVALPQGEQARLEAVLAALRSYLLEPRPESPDLALWPEGLSAPRVFIVETGDRADAVVLDFDLAETTGPSERGEVSVSQELRLLASIRRTVRLHAGDRGVHLLVGGRPRPSLLGHVALSGALE